MEFAGWTLLKSKDTRGSHLSYLLGRLRLEDQGSKPAQANSSQDSISKITRAKWTRGVAQAIELCKHEAMSSNPSPTKTKQKQVAPLTRPPCSLPTPQSPDQGRLSHLGIASRAFPGCDQPQV
jgi:hypothetical protein